MTPRTFGRLWKMNEAPLPQTAPLVGTPRTAGTGLIRQATRAIMKGQDRGHIMRQLVTSTMRRPAAVVPPPASPSPAAAAAPSASGAALPAASSGFGGAGYSGNNAAILGQPSNPGFVRPA